MEAPMNEFLVSSNGKEVVVMMPLRGPLSKERAVALAAWLVAVSGATAKEFSAVLSAVESS